MGRRPRFCPPLISNPCAGTVASLSPALTSSEKCTASNDILARLSVVAACHREKLKSEVEEGVSGNVPSQMMGTLPPLCSNTGTSSQSFAPLSCGLDHMDSSCTAPSCFARLHSQEGVQRTKKRMSPRATIPLFRSPQRITKDKLNVQGGVQSSKKRKSPCVTRPAFISPLSRMLTSPRVAVDVTKSALVAEDELVQDIVDDLVQNTLDNLNQDPGIEHGQDTLDDLVQDTIIELDTEDELVQDEISAPVTGRGPRPMVRNDKRKLIIGALIARARKVKLDVHATREVSAQFSVSMRTVQRFWNEGRRCLNRGVAVDVSHKKYKCGRKKKDIDLSVLKGIPMSKRNTMHDVATHLHCSTGKAYNLKKEGAIKRVSSTIKPYLTQQNKKDRLQWCMFMLEPESIPHSPIFKGLFDYIFLDEKWFNISRKAHRFYVLPDEEIPARACKNKNYMPKIMFLTAVARPRFDYAGNCTFDGRIGCFPLVRYEPAKRSSVNRPAGTIEMKPILSIKKAVIQEFMAEKLLPAIRANWPFENAHEVIHIQQDNATSHVSPSDRIFSEACKEQGLNIRVVCQPANSPDLNVLDLGFFNSIQSIQYRSASRTTEELVAAVDWAFNNYSVHQANRIFLTLHSCMREVMKIDGGNEYNVPHIRKGVLERQGCLPLQLKCDSALVQSVMEKSMAKEKEEIVSHNTKPKKCLNNQSTTTKEFMLEPKDQETMNYINAAEGTKKLVVYGEFSLDKNQMQCLLKPNGWLESETVNACIQLLKTTTAKERDDGTVYIETSYLSKMLWRDRNLETETMDVAERNYIVQQKLEYLKHDMVFLPINIDNIHWMAVVVNSRQREIQILDSMNYSMPENVVQGTLQGLEKHFDLIIRLGYYKDYKKWKNTKVTTWPRTQPIKHKMQHDSYSCGLFMLKFFDNWTGNKLSPLFTQKDITNFRLKLPVQLVNAPINEEKGSPGYASSASSGKACSSNSSDHLSCID